MDRAANVVSMVTDVILAALPEMDTVTRDGATLAVGDSRKLLEALPDESVHCVITSPPYGELKDYGAAGQLGFGQGSTSEYLQDLAKVLKELFRVCADGAAFWVVLDTFKASGKRLVLPWEVIKRAEEARWRFEDVVIWDKGRTLPWSHVGHFRGIFEYVLLFSRDHLKHFSLDRVRETDHLSPYWVRYPERYNPFGKAPSDLWHFPIPVQGSWSRNGIRHSCPFPVGMIARMIALTTEPGHIVLDPFAGTGTVPAVASSMKRIGIGIDLNPAFAREFGNGGFDALTRVATAEFGGHAQPHRRGLASLIVQLRTLKYPRVLFSELSRPDRLGSHAREHIAGFVVTKLGYRLLTRGKSKPLARAALWVLLREDVPADRIRGLISQVASVPPLSKYGIECEIHLVAKGTWHRRSFFAGFVGVRWFLYTKGNFTAYDCSLGRAQIFDTMKPFGNANGMRFPPILANIRVNLRATSL